MKAALDVRLRTAGGDWLIRECRIVQQSGQKPWFSLPVASWENEHGKICYKTVLELPPCIKSRITKVALEAYSEIQAKAA